MASVAGRYVVEAVEDEAPALSPEEEAGMAALESYKAHSLGRARSMS
jgi:hypothetical protein